MAKIGIISLGCPRNLVDSEIMLSLLKGDGHKIVDIEDAEIAIVNTCSFIDEAKAESVDTILDAIEIKNQGSLKGIIVAGCLAQRYKEKLKKELKEADGFIGTGDLDRISDALKDILAGKKAYYVSDTPPYYYEHNHKHATCLTPPHYRYIKIQEGCGNSCSYCVIPIIKGGLKSRPMDSILSQINSLPLEVLEINIVGQDITMYGLDLYKELKLAELIEKIAGLKKLKWIRLLYMHPARMSDDLIRVIRDNESVCKYVDLPIQHISDKILRLMNRTTKDQICDIIKKVRSQIPGAAIRTTLIVGFPGEDEKDFRELADFVRDARFERLGVFKYSREEETNSYAFPNQVQEGVKQARFDEIMKIQKEISASINKTYLGKVVEVLIDEPDESRPEWYLARTQHDAPEVDGGVWVKNKNSSYKGQFLKVKITDTLEYDLVGEAL